jgi:hypothetical protein
VAILQWPMMDFILDGPNFNDMIVYVAKIEGSGSFWDLEFPGSSDQRYHLMIVQLVLSLPEPVSTCISLDEVNQNAFLVPYSQQFLGFGYFGL